MNRDIPFYPFLTPEQQDLLDRSVQQISYKKGQVVHRHGDACVGIIFVRKGRLSFYALSEEGREITILRAKAGQTCVLSASCVFQAVESESHITAEVASEVAVLPASILAQLMHENKDVERLVYQQASNQYAGALNTLQRIVFFSLEKRLACFLRDEGEYQNTPVFSATHEQIARHIGSSREVVTRMLNQFASRGIVSLGRGTVTVMDHDALEDLTF
ncbi:MAG: Crp/Fnr family transcriptional regulator [Ruminiclostridium sp.]|nr:Crp/Fnr family transcriptional regulator [Ruminiclostridium sp.]